MIKLALLPAVALLLCSCGGKETSAAEAKGAAAPKAEVASAEPGSWRRSDGTSGMALSFGSSSDRPLAVVRCDHASEALLIERAVDHPPSGLDRIRIKTDEGVERLPAVYDPATTRAVATVQLEDRLADDLSRVSGTWAIDLKAAPELVLPADRRIGTLIEKCRHI